MLLSYITLQMNCKPLSCREARQTCTKIGTGCSRLAYTHSLFFLISFVRSLSFLSFLRSYKYELPRQYLSGTHTHTQNNNNTN